MSSRIKRYISLKEASKLCDYSQEYLSLRARQGKLKAYKIGNIWCTTKKDLADYVLKNKGREAAEKILPQAKKIKIQKVEKPQKSQYILDLSLQYGRTEIEKKEWREEMSPLSKSRSSREKELEEREAWKQEMMEREKAREKRRISFFSRHFKTRREEKVKDFPSLQPSLAEGARRRDLARIGETIQSFLENFKVKRPLALVASGVFLILIILGSDLFLFSQSASARLGEYRDMLERGAQSVQESVKDIATYSTKVTTQLAQSTVENLSQTIEKAEDALEETKRELTGTVETMHNSGKEVLQQAREVSVAVIEVVDSTNQIIEEKVEEIQDRARKGFYKIQKSLGVEVDEFKEEEVGEEVQIDTRDREERASFWEVVALGAHKSKEDIKLKITDIGGTFTALEEKVNKDTLSQLAEDTLLTVGESLIETGTTIKENTKKLGQEIIKGGGELKESMMGNLQETVEGIAKLGRVVYQKYDHFTTGLANIYNVYQGNLQVTFTPQELAGEEERVEGIEVRKSRESASLLPARDELAEEIVKGVESEEAGTALDQAQTAGVQRSKGETLVGKRAELGSLKNGERGPSVLVHEEGNIWTAGNLEVEGIGFVHQRLKVGSGFVVDSKGQVVAFELNLGQARLNQGGLNIGEKFIVDGASGDLEMRGDLFLKSGFLEIGYDRDGEARFYVDDKSGNIYTQGNLTVSEPSLFKKDLDVDRDLRVDGDTLRVVSSSHRVGIKTANPQYDLDLNGNLRVTGDVLFEGTATTNGATTLKGNLVVGDSTSDTITFTSRVSSSFVPSSDNSYDLGSNILEWRNLYIDGIGYLDAITLLNEERITNTTNGDIVFSDSSTAQTLTLDLDTASNINLTSSTGLQLNSTTQDLIFNSGSGDVYLAAGDNLLPATNGSGTLGDASHYWAQAYIQNLILGTTSTGDFILDDGAGDSPRLILRDGDDFDFTLYKADTGEGYLINNEGAIYLQPSGDTDNYFTLATTANIPTFSVSASTALNITANAASTWSTSSGLLSIAGAGGITLTSTGGTLTINVTGQSLDIDSGAAALDATTLSIDSTDTTNLTMTADSVADKTLTISATNSDVAGKGLIAINAEGDLALDTSSGTLYLNNTNNQPINTGTGTLTADGALVVNGAFTLGDGGDTGSVNSSGWTISTAGALSGIASLTGDAGGISIYGGTGASDALTLVSTTNATKGNIYFHTTSYYINSTGDLVIGGRLTFENSDYVSNETDGYILFQGSGGTDDTDLTFDLDGSYPIIYSATDSKVGIDDDLELVGAQTISTSAGDLTLDAGSNLVISDATVQFNNTTQTFDIYSATGTTTLQIKNSDATQVANLDLVDGALYTNGIQRIDNSGNLTNIGTISAGAITTTGTLTFSGVGTDITTGTNEDLTIAPNGTGGLTVSADAIDIDGTTVAIDGSTSISIGTTLDKPIDIDSSTLDIDASGNITLDTSSTATITLTTANGTITLDTTASGNAINLNAGTGAVTIAGSAEGTTALGITAGDLVITDGDLTLSSGEASFTSPSTTADSKALTISQTGATTGTDYGLYVTNTGAATTNVAGYFSASGATTNNYGLIVENGNVGIGETTPLAKLEVDTDDGDNVIGLIVDQDDTTNNNTALEIQNAGTGSSLVIDTNEFIIDDEGNVAIITNTSTVTPLSITADSIDDDTGIALSVDALTTGKGLDISSSSNAIDSAQIIAVTVNPAAATDTTLTADIANLAFNPTYSTAITTPAISGNVLDLSRSITTNASFASTLTVSGALATLSDTATQTTGTLTHTADILFLDQNYAASTGNIINIDSESTAGDIINIDAENTSGTLIDIQWSTATQTGAITGIDLDFDTLTDDNSNTIYGMRINDFNNAGGGAGTQYAIYQQGANWDYGAYFEDDVYMALDLTIDGGNLNFGADTTIGDGGDAIAVSLKNNVSDALDIQQGADDYININTTDSSEAVTIGNTTTNPDISLTSGTGEIDLTSTNTTASAIDINAEGTGGGVDIDTTDGAIALTAGGAANGNVTITAGNDITVDASAEASNVSIIAGDNEPTAAADGNDVEILAEDDVILQASDVIDINATGEVQIDGALVDIGTGAYSYVDGDNDLGVAGDLEVQGTLYSTGDIVITESGSQNIFTVIDSTTTDTGTAESGGNNTLTDTNKSWTTNAYVNYVITLTSGTGKGQVRLIQSNTATQITVKDNWDTNPDSTTTYSISMAPFVVSGDSNIYLDSSTSLYGKTTADIISSLDNSKLLHLTMDKDYVNYTSGTYPSTTNYVFGQEGETGTFTEAFGYRTLTGGTSPPSALSSEKGILITQSDNLQYSRGSHNSADGAGVVYENFNPNQGTLEFWVRPNWDNTDSNSHYVFDSSAVKLYFDASNDSWTATANGATITKSDTFSAGEWTYILVTWDANANTLDLEVDGVSATQVTTSQTASAPSSVLYLGQNSSNANIFNGTIAGRITQKIESSNYNSGAGSTDTFTVTPDTVWMGTYSDSDTDAVFHHRGQEVTSTQSAVTDAVTLNEAVGGRSWTDNDRVVIYDGTGYKVEGQLASTPTSTDTTLDVDNGSGAAVTDIEKVGVSLDFDATYNAQAADNTIHDITTQDIGLSAWVRVDSDTAVQVDFLSKRAATDSGYRVFLNNGAINFLIEDGDGDVYTLSGNTDIRDNKWHHIAVIIDRDNAANCKVYLDGYEDGTTNKVGTLTDVGSITSPDIMTLGSRVGGTYKFDGQIRDVILSYPEANTTGEVIGTGDGTTTSFSGTFTNGTTIPNSVTIYYTIGATNYTATDDGAGNITGTSVSGTITYNTGAWTLTFTTAPDNATDITADYTYSDITAANEMGASGEILTLATNPRDFTTVNHEDAWELSDNAANTTVAATGTGSANGGAGYDLTASADTNTFSTQEAFISKNLIADAGMENGGVGAGWSYFSSAVTRTKSTDAKYDTQSLHAEVSGVANERLVSPTITIADTENYLVRFWYKIANGNNSQFEINEVGGSLITYTSLTSSTWDAVEIAYKPSSGTTAIQLRFKEFTASNDMDLYLDQLQLLPNLVDNGGMENVTTGNVDGWTKAGMTEDTAVATPHSGTYGLRVYDDSASVTEFVYQQDASMFTVGKWYTLSGWVRAASGTGTAGIKIVDTGTATFERLDISVDTTYKRFSLTFKAQSGVDAIELWATSTSDPGSGTGDVYFDDVSLIELDQADAETATPSSSANSFSTGKWGDTDGAFLVDGGDTLTYPTSGNINASQGTIAMWVKPNGNGWANSRRKGLFETRTSDAGGEQFILAEIQADNTIRYDVRYNGISQATLTYDVSGFSANSWHHIAFSWQTNGFYLYVDGDQVASDTSGNTAASLPTDLKLGYDSSASNRQADAFFDDVRVYNEVLTADQIKALYQAKDLKRAPGASKFAINTTAIQSGGTDTALTVSQAGSGIASVITNLGTGLSFKVEDELNDTTPFVIDASGNVGIGTTGPEVELHTYASGENAEIYIERDSGGKISIQAQSAYGKIGTISNHPLGFITNIGERMTITTGGNVGIGQTNPGARLEVEVGATDGVAALLLDQDDADQSVLTIQSVNTSGAIVDIDITPAAASTATLFDIDATNSNFNGTFFDIDNNSSNIYTLDTTQAIYDVPVAFNAAGGVSIAYDLVLTNTTAGYIKFNGPGYVQTDDPSGNFDLTLSAANSGQVIINDNFKITGKTEAAPSTTQTLAAVDAITVNATHLKVAGSGGAVTLTSTPTIADGTEGEIIVIRGTDNTNTVTIQDQGTLASSNLELGSTTRTLGNGDSIGLLFDGSVWVELWFSGGIDADYAEMYKIAEDVEAGDVVAFTDDYLKVGKADINDKDIAGIISAHPAYLIGKQFRDEMQMPVGLAGRVPVKVSLEAGEIKKGDLLIPATKPGYAMKYNPDYLLELKNASSTDIINIPVVAIALEDYDGTTDVPKFLETEYVSLDIQFTTDDLAEINSLKAKYKISSEDEIRSEYLEKIAQEDLVKSFKIISKRVEQKPNPEYEEASDDKILAMIKTGYVNVGGSSTKLTLTEQEGRLVVEKDEGLTGENSLALEITPDGTLKIEKLETQELAVKKGITLYDKDSERAYCIFIQKGELQKSEGRCTDELETKETIVLGAQEVRKAAEEAERGEETKNEEEKNKELQETVEALVKQLSGISELNADISTLGESVLSTMESNQALQERIEDLEREIEALKQALEGQDKEEENVSEKDDLEAQIKALEEKKEKLKKEIEDLKANTDD